ncbi:MAG: metallophosphoesterase [Pseudomonadota bacterium]
MTGLGAYEYLKLAVFYGSYLSMPLGLYAVATLRGAGPVGGLVRLCVVIGVIVFAYARFVEPRILLTRHHDAPLERCFAHEGALRIAVFSDTHIGLFKNAMPIDRIVAAVAREKPDAVMIAGDFTYYLHPTRFSGIYQSLSALEAPVIGVLGNHDIGFPGPDLTGPLAASLEGAGVSVIDNERIGLLKGDRRIEVVGLSELMGDQQQLSLILELAPDPRIVLTHNPGTADVMPYKGVFDLMIAGHTHGGQIYIPFVTCRIFEFVCRVTRYGLARHRRGLVFVTSGTGMVDLPLRFAAPPRIDILTVRYKRCAQTGG